MADGILKTYLVTGGAGFIGSHFIENVLCNSGTRVVNLDKLTYAGNMHNLSGFSENQNHIFIKGDICDRRLLDKIFNEYEIDCVVNFAAESHVDRSISHSYPFIHTNVIGVMELLEAAKGHWNNFNGKLFLQISTDEVYGSLSEGVFADEKSLQRPGNPYSASKAAADLLVMSYFNTYKMPVIVTRSCNNFGSRQHFEKFIPTMVNCLKKGEKLPLYGDGLNEREWIYVKDHCSRLLDILNFGQAGEIYNIGSGCIQNNIDVIRKIIGIYNGITGSELDESVISYVKDRKGHDRRYALDYSKALKFFNWAESSDFAQTLQETIQSYL